MYSSIVSGGREVFNNKTAAENTTKYWRIPHEEVAYRRCLLGTFLPLLLLRVRPLRWYGRIDMGLALILIKALECRDGAGEDSEYLWYAQALPLWGPGGFFDAVRLLHEQPLGADRYGRYW